MKTKLIILAVMLFGTVLAKLIAASSVSLAWEHSPSFTNYPGSVVYRIYHQTNVPPTTNFNAVGVTTFDAGTNAYFTHTGLSLAVPNVWAVTAVGTTNGIYSGMESDFSNWVQFGPFATVAQVTNVRMRP